MRLRELLAWHPSAAILIGGAMLLRAAFHGSRSLLAVILMLTVLLPCILWPNAAGQGVGFSHVTRTSHGGVLSFVAWALLLPLAWLCLT